MGKLRFFTVVLTCILLMFVLGCTTKQTSNGAASAEEKIKQGAGSIFQSAGTQNIDLKKTVGGYDIKVTYTPAYTFRYTNEDAEKNAFVNVMYRAVAATFALDPQIKSVTVNALQSSTKLIANPKGSLYVMSQTKDSLIRELARSSINKTEFNKLKETYEDPQYMFGGYVEFSPFFLVELKLKTNKVGVKNVLVGIEENNTTNMTIADIVYEPTGMETLGDKREDKKQFEENFANIIRYSFEADPSIDYIYLTANSYRIDNRSGNLTATIANFSMSRKEFEQIMDDWDNLRYKIYDKMDYTPIFLLDLVSIGKIQKLEIGPTAKVDYYLDSFKKIQDSFSTMETDLANVVYAMLQVNGKVQSVQIFADAKVPAKEGQETVDGVNKIIHNFAQVTVSRSQATAINRDNLKDKYVLSNFNTVWNEEGVGMYMTDLLAFKDSAQKKQVDDIRAITFSNQMKSASIFLDSCYFYQLKKDKEATIKTKLEQSGNKTLYLIHPPYLDEVEFTVQKITYDPTGKETVADIGYMKLTKAADTPWFNWDPNAVDSWYDVSDENFDITDELVLCQRAG